MEKNLQNLESDSKELGAEVKSLQQAKAESEYRRKKVEAQLQELLSRAAEAEKSKAELSERSHRLQVSPHSAARKLPPARPSDPALLSLPPQVELDNISALLEESESKGVKLAKEADKLSSKVQDLEVRGLLGRTAKGQKKHLANGRVTSRAGAAAGRDASEAPLEQPAPPAGGGEEHVGGAAGGGRGGSTKPGETAADAAGAGRTSRKIPAVVR